MNSPRTLMLVGAHPDDESFGMGATLAKYTAEGIKAYYVCATGGEAGTVEPRFLEGYSSVFELRCAEMKKAAEALGLAGVLYLGYRDSGMPGWDDNRHPDALMNASVDEAAGRLVRIMREIKPQVVITHDPNGGYNHPDHIATHKITMKAFYACGDNRQYPETGPAYQPAKLYYLVRSHRLLKIMIKVLSFFGSNVHKFGRNQDIDLTKIVAHEYPIHAYVRLTKTAMETRIKAAACHASQGGGRPPGRGPGLFGFVNMVNNLGNRLFGYRDFFMREYPAVKSKKRENDLFAGI
ncbi:MAG TPA: PIG-L deacetylase family protein [Dehalococcoidales bacterium]|nr:PIG-L deacetylase family protein [Dehalococcoidales bacterium]